MEKQGCNRSNSYSRSCKFPAQAIDQSDKFSVVATDITQKTHISAKAINSPLPVFCRSIPALCLILGCYMPATHRPTLFWFRRDLRLQDNPALRWAVQQGKPVICFYIHSNNVGDEWHSGGASQWWLHHSLESLAADLKTAGTRLCLFTGDPEKIIDQIVKDTGAGAIAWNRRYEPNSIELDKKLKAHYTNTGLDVHSTPGNLSHEPWQVKREGKHPYRVFTAYWRASLKHPSLPVTPAVRTIPQSATAVKGKLKGECKLGDLNLLPDLPWAAQFPDHWQPGEKGAAANLRSLLKNRISNYGTDRDIPSNPGTSRLSPHLAFGEISPRQINAAVAKKLKNKTLVADENVETFLKEIGWREFAYHLLYNFPHTVEQPLNKEYRLSLAGRCTVVLGYISRRRSGQQHHGLAVGSRQRC